MENIDINKIKKVILNYNSLPIKDKKLVDDKINSIWSKVVADFMELCSNDKNLIELKNKLQDLNSVLNYNYKENFETYAYTANEEDPEFAEDIYEFDQKYFNECKHLAENWTLIEKELIDKINALKNSKFAPFREDRINKLNIDLKSKKEKVELYNKSKEQQDKHLNLLKNKDTLYSPYKKQYNELLTKYATQTLEKHLNNTPSIVCIEHTSLISSSEFDINFDMSELNRICNDVRNQANELLKSDILNSLSL